MFPEYDVIVVGGGHAGCEAAAAAAQMGSKTLLITMNLQNLAQMSCNPAMGGIAKGQIIREIDALGGRSGVVTDKSMIQFRMLNKSKGPAMWSPRAQCDRALFTKTWREILELIPNLDFYQDNVVALMKEDNETVTGVKTKLGHSIRSKTVILTNGTFLNGRIHIGSASEEGGRISEANSTGITEQLTSWGFVSSRLKTGTPPRVDGRSLDYSKMVEQKGDDIITGFSFIDNKKPDSQKSCWIAYTNPDVHKILKEGFNESPMYQGRITGTGPRYCPSIEDKITRFADKERHQLFVEPEGWNTIEMYINGFSSSLPEHIQLQGLRCISGFEKCKLFRPGYAIEYDFFPPTQLKYTLETKLIRNLFFAGQINGTTGYEEAACQGLMAGINAHQIISSKPPFILKRNEAYIGVLIDDLISKGTDEPYRMFTSRAEFRTLLRQDNADLRLTEKGYNLGLAPHERLINVESKKQGITSLKHGLSQTQIEPEEINAHLLVMNSSPISEPQNAASLLLRPGITLQALIQQVYSLQNLFKDSSTEIIEQVEIQIKYETYLKKEAELVLRMKSLEEQTIPDSFDYHRINSLSNEARQKFISLRPKTFGQASRISGVNPSDLQILLVYMGR